MKDQGKTKGQLIDELAVMRRRVVELEKTEIERKQSEEAPYEVEDMFRLFLDYSPIYVFFKDENIRSLQLSKNYEKMLGRPVHELIGKTMDDLFPSELAKSMVEDDLRILRERKPIEVEEELNGRFYTTTKFPITREGKPPLLAGFTIEITERKRMEEALRKSEEYFRRLTKQSPVPIAIIGDNGEVDFLNERFIATFGYTLDHLPNLGTWLQLAYPDEQYRQEVIATWQKGVERAGSEPGDIEPHEYRVMCKDGTIRIVEIFGSRIENKILVLLNDITERKRVEEALHQSEERFRELYHRAPMGCLEYEAEGRITSVNHTGLEMLGYTAEEMIGQPLWEFNAGEEIAQQQILAKLAGRLLPGTSYECTYRRKDGMTIPVLIWDRLILDKKGGIKGIGCMIQDITQLKQTEAEKAYLREQLHHAQKMEAIGTLAGGIAHDFNNILAVILGFAELASLDIEENSKAKYNLQQVMKAAHRAKDLVQQILTFGRQGRKERKPLDIKPIIKEGLKFLRASLPATIEIQQDIEGDFGAIDADATQLYQVLMNLCTNAAHAMDKKGGVLKVSLSKLHVDGGTSAAFGQIETGSYLRLRVSDTGHGMPPEILEKIFVPYFTTKAVGRGSGLGLAVIHGIVKSHGGGITVSSEVGKGSTFDIYFPRIEAAYVSSETDVVKPLPLGRHERVLFVDDEEPIVEIGRYILQYLGYEVVVRTSSIEALELFRVQADRFDLVITDMTMPNMTGDELAQELLRIRPGIPIIICTGFSEHITEEKAKTIGIREFAMKPLAMEELAHVMRRALDHQKKEKG